MRRWVGVGLGVWFVAAGWLVACVDDANDTPLTLPIPDGATDATRPSTTDAAEADSSIAVDARSEAAADAGSDARLDDASSDADADAALPILKRVSGSIDFNGPFAGAKVELLAPTQESLITDATGDFFFFAPVGSVAWIKATPPEDAGAFPMIRGLVVEDGARIRVFYLQSTADIALLSGLGITVDPTKAIVQVDFRNASVGGYGATMQTKAGATVTPGFGIASGAGGMPVESLLTVRGGDGSTLTFGNVDPGEVSFTPIVPQDAGKPATACDAPTLPLQAGVVTWFDFECGVADCH